MFRALPASVGNNPAALRAQCVAMRDFVVRLRKDLVTQFAAPVVPGVFATSQPLMAWKLQAFATHRRDFDRAALRNDTDPAPVAPRKPDYPRLEEESAPRNIALSQISRAHDPDLVVPAAEHARYEAAFARFCSVFPDAFFISERGRYYPDDSEDKGRLLSAGFHNVMGYFRDDIPLEELILDGDGKKQLDRLWDEFDFIADYTTRTWIQYFLNQSGQVLGRSHEKDLLQPSDHGITDARVIFAVRDAYLAKIAPANNPVAEQSAWEHFERVNNTIRAVEKMRADAEPLHLQALLRFAARAYRRPLSKAENEDLLAYYRKLRDQNGLNHEDAIRDSIVSILMAPDFLYHLEP
jgi:hypothetical protein